MRRPKISVCVPTYNGRAYLSDTLRSISEQTFQDYEVVIVDDGSNDDTIAIAENYAGRDARVRVMRNDDRAGSSAQNANRCVSYARGEWIKLLFQDDLMAPTCLAHMLEASSACRFVVCWHDFIFHGDVDEEIRNGYREAPSLRTTFHNSYVSVDEFCNAVLDHWRNFIGPTSSSFIHRSCFERYGGFSSEMLSFPDLDYWIRVGSGEGLAVVPEALITFRVHDRSISGQIRDDPAARYRYRLDRLRLALKLGRAPEYENLRMAARNRTPPLDTESLILREARAARWSAVDIRFRRRDETALREWRSVCSEHPEVPVILRRADVQASFFSKLKLYVKAHL